VRFARRFVEPGGVAGVFGRPVFWLAGQQLTRLSRDNRLFVALVVAISITTGAGCGAPGTSTPQNTGENTGAPAGGIPRGGNLVVSVRAEPRSFFRLTARDSTTELLSNFMQAKLVRINKVSQEVEPWLAESWTRSADGRRYTLKLRPGVVFSDGQPFTSADVLFAFRAVYDEKTGSNLADSLQTNGSKLQVTAIDPLTVEIAFAEPFAAGVRLLDNLPILPRHKLEASLDAGRLGDAWSLSTPPSEVVGLGPFVLAQYVPGQRVILDRNPRYFMKAPDGSALPYLDRVTVEIIPDQSAEQLRLEAGQIDMMSTEIAPEAYAPLKRAADAGRVRLLDLGPSLNANSLWFNLKPGAFAGDPRAAWLQRDELRQAISLAVDRKLFADTVYLGAAVPVFGNITPANKKWYWAGLPQTPHDPEAAKRKLAAIGLTDRNGDGMLEDARNRPAQFTLLTQKGRADLERAGAVIRDEMKKVGVVVDVVGLEVSALIDRFANSGKYDAVYFSPFATDTDPALNPDFWFSFGSAHLWNMAQKAPATEWEKRIDELMAKQIASPDESERKKLFDEVQQLFAEHEPVVYFVAPRVYVAVSSRVANLTPAVSRPQTLWAPDRLAVNK
jgi:peptide/nickel transport system substrate-binding protein